MAESHGKPWRSYRRNFDDVIGATCFFKRKKTLSVTINNSIDYFSTAKKMIILWLKQKL
jgi:hypothetical protein